jgi:hypothetical protein
MFSYSSPSSPNKLCLFILKEKTVRLIVLSFYRYLPKVAFALTNELYDHMLVINGTQSSVFA